MHACADTRLQTCEHDRLAEAVEQQRQGRCRERHGVSAVHNEEGVVDIARAVQEAGQPDPVCATERVSSAGPGGRASNTAGSLLAQNGAAAAMPRSLYACASHFMKHLAPLTPRTRAAYHDVLELVQ